MKMKKDTKSIYVAPNRWNAIYEIFTCYFCIQLLHFDLNLFEFNVSAAARDVVASVRHSLHAMAVMPMLLNTNIAVVITLHCKQSSAVFSFPFKHLFNI